MISLFLSSALLVLRTTITQAGSPSLPHPSSSLPPSQAGQEEELQQQSSYLRGLNANTGDAPGGGGLGLYLNTPITPSNELPEGHAAKCMDDPQMKVYRWTNHQLRWYPTGKIADSYDLTWQKDLALLDCNGEDPPLLFGPDMPKRIVDGTIVSCYGDTDDIKIYVMGRDDKLHWISHPDIADSYNIRWRKEAKYIHCNLYEYSDDDAMMKTTHRMGNDGDIVTCYGDEKKVYRIEDGTLRWYPTPPVAYSWTHYWRPQIVVDCGIYHFGPDMPFHTPPAWVKDEYGMWDHE